MNEGKKKFTTSAKGASLGSLKASLGDQIGKERLDELQKELAEEESPGELGGFRPASDILAEAETEGGGNDIGTAATTAMPKSDPPAPREMVPPSAEAAAQETNVALSASMEIDAAAVEQAVANPVVDQNKVVTVDAPAVDPATVPQPSPDPVSNAPAPKPPLPAAQPPADRKAATAQPAAAASAPVSASAPTVAAAPAPRPAQHRVAMPPATPARLFWVNYRTRIIVASIVACLFVLGLMTLSGVAGYTYALRDVAPLNGGDAIAVGETRVPLPAETDGTEPPAERVEAPRPARAVMPPEPARETAPVAPRTAPETGPCRVVQVEPGRRRWICDGE